MARKALGKSAKEGLGKHERKGKKEKKSVNFKYEKAREVMKVSTEYLSKKGVVRIEKRKAMIRVNRR